MKRAVLSVWLLLFLSGCRMHYFIDDHEKLACINIIDRNGMSETFNSADRLKRYDNVDFLSPQPYQKVLRVYSRDQNGDVRSYITSYHENGQIKQYLEVVNNRAFGTYKEWFSNGILKVDASVISGAADLTMGAERTWLFEGCSKVFDEEGFLEAEIHYVKGELQGDSIYYHANGAVWKIVPFIKNAIDGEFKTFQDCGQLLSSTTYRHGCKNGRAIRFWDADQIAAEEMYEEDRLASGIYYALDGHEISRVENGKGFKVLFSRTGISELQEYRNGIQEGVVKMYDNRNRLVGYYHMKNGVKHGEEMEYYDSYISGKESSPKISLEWHEGKIQGIGNTWFSSGQQESKKEFSNNKKNGLSSAWYEDGNLMLIEEYAMNKLVRGEYYKIGERHPVSTVNQGKGVATLFDSQGHLLKKVNYVNGHPEE